MQAGSRGLYCMIDSLLNTCCECFHAGVTSAGQSRLYGYGCRVHCPTSSWNLVWLEILAIF